MTITELLDRAGETTGEIAVSIETAAAPGLTPELALAVAESVRQMQAERLGDETEALGLLMNLVKERTA